MKKSFKRFLSSVLATVMAVAGMSVGMTTTAMAAADDYSYELYCATTSTYVNTDNYFTVAASRQTSADALVDDTSAITNLAGEELDLTAASMAMKGNGDFSIDFTTSADSSTVTIWWAGKQNSTSNVKMGIDGSQVGNTITNTDGLQKIEETVSAGSHNIARNSGESVVYYISVVENFSDTAAEYTITGTSNLESGDSFNFGTTTANVGEGGAWTATVTLDNAPTETDTFAVSKDGYSVDPSSVTVTGSGTSYTVSTELKFTEYVFSEIPEGTYTNSQIREGLPYFDTTNLTSANDKYATGESFNIMLSDTATVTVNGKSGSGTTTNTAYVTVNGVDGEEKVGGASFSDDVFKNVPAGTITISFTAATTYQLASITVKYETSQTYTWKLNTDDVTVVDKDKIGLASTETTGTTNTLTYSGSDYTVVADKATVTGTPDENNVITVTVDDSFFEEVVVGDNVITDQATLVADETLATDLKNTLSTDYTYGKFVLMNGMSVDDDNSVTVDGLGSYTYRLKTGGKPSNTTSIPDKRAIKFETSGPATLQVVGIASGSNNTYTYAVWSSSGDIISTPTVTSTAATSSLITLPSADTYYIASYSGTCIFYSVNVVIGSTETVDNGNVLFDTTDGYMIASVTEDNLASEKIVVTAGTDSVEDTVVYAAALIDGHLITAEDLGAEYIYVVKGTNAVVNGAIDTVKEFTVSFE